MIPGKMKSLGQKDMGGVFFFLLFIYFLAMLGLRCCVGFYLVEVHRLLITWLLLLQSTGSQVPWLQWL